MAENGNPIHPDAVARLAMLESAVRACTASPGNTAGEARRVDSAADRVHGLSRQGQTAGV